MPSSTASASSLATLALLLFTSTTAAQLVGCDAVGCPVDDYRTAQCSVGNATLKALGIANVTTALDAQPLTWTLGLQELKTPDANVTLDRNFYLGIPPSVQLNNTVGCALIFDGVAANLSATKGDDEKFTCSRALADSCITDLISQAQTNYGDAGKDGKGGADFCNKLRDSLVDQPPKTCNGLQGSWGAISARPLTGSPAPQPVDQTQCHPTTGKDYNMFLVQSSRQENIGRDSSQLSPIIDRVTPVMTVFAKDNKADVQLTCLRLVESKAGQTVDSPTQKGAAAGLNSPPAVLLSALLAVGYFLVL